MADMKAVVVTEFGDENVLVCRPAPVPEPAEGEVRVRMRAAGVNPVETYIRSGNYGTLPKLPYIPGNDGAGVVDKVGPGVEGLAPGQRVFVIAALAARCSGTYAQYAVCDAGSVRPLPESMSFAEGAGLGTPALAAVYGLFFKARIQPGEVVLIHGAAGGVGSLAVQLARRAGAVVFGTAGNPEGEEMLRGLGVHKVFNHRRDGYPEQIVKESQGRGPDVIIEVMANVNLVKDLAMLAKYGRIVVIGNRGSLDFNPRTAMVKDAVISGLMINNMSPADFKAAMFLLAAALESGLKVTVDGEFKLEAAPQAHSRVLEDQKRGKIILSID